MSCDEIENKGVVVLEEAEVGINTCQPMREIRELSDLKELLFFHLTIFQFLLYNVLRSQKYAFLSALGERLEEVLAEEGVGVL